MHVGCSRSVNPISMCRGVERFIRVICHPPVLVLPLAFNAKWLAAAELFREGAVQQSARRLHYLVEAVRAGGGILVVCCWLGDLGGRDAIQYTPDLSG